MKKACWFAGQDVALIEFHGRIHKTKVDRINHITGAESYTSSFVHIGGFIFHWSGTEQLTKFPCRIEPWGRKHELKLPDIPHEELLRLGKQVSPLKEMVLLGWLAGETDAEICKRTHYDRDKPSLVTGWKRVLVRELIRLLAYKELRKTIEASPDFKKLPVTMLPQQYKRVEAVLRQLNVRTLGDLVQLTEKDLYRVKGCARTTVHDLQSTLAHLGLTLRTTDRSKTFRVVLDVHVTVSDGEELPDLHDMKAVLASSRGYMAESIDDNVVGEWVKDRPTRVDVKDVQDLTATTRAIPRTDSWQMD